jgi:protein SCO1/2
MAAVAAGVAMSVSAAPEGSPWGAGYFPDVPLVTHQGKTVRFYSDLVKDKSVVVNFIYTHCTKACPLETANLVRVQKLLGARVGRDVFMYSITMDPKRDTPEVLARYAEAYRAGPGWLFLTGRSEDVKLLRARFGDLSTLEDHAIGLEIGNDPAGQWTSLSAIDDPAFLAATIESWTRTDWRDHAGVKSYAEAPRIAPPGRGEDLFRRKCSACHGVGRSDLVGPDLAGVTRRRDRAWLARWLAHPDALLAEGDPLALELLAKPQQVDLGLTERDVGAILEFLTEKDRRPAR